MTPRYLLRPFLFSALCTANDQFLEILLSKICPWVIVHYSPFDRLRANGFCLWFIVHRASDLVAATPRFVSAVNPNISRIPGFLASL